MAGNKSAIAEMARYNRQDVDLLADVFEKLIPYVPSRVNAALFSEKPACPNCGSHKLQKRGPAVNRTSVHQRYQCMGCGGWSTSPKDGGMVR
jgi:hypothetical protein